MSSLSRLGTGALSNSAFKSSISSGTEASNSSLTLVLVLPEIDILCFIDDLHLSNLSNFYLILIYLWKEILDSTTNTF